LTEREIVLERRLVTPAVPDGVRYLHGIDVVALAELVANASSVPELFDRYTAAASPADLPSFLTALATAVARGWLID
jgi:hypothetical protein